MTEGLATAVFVLGLLTFTNGISGIVALALAPSARRRIRASNGALTGMGFVTAGVILAAVGLLMLALAIAIPLIHAFRPVELPSQ